MVLAVLVERMQKAPLAEVFAPTCSPQPIDQWFQAHKTGLRVPLSLPSFIYTLVIMQVLPLVWLLNHLQSGTTYLFSLKASL